MNIGVNYLREHVTDDVRMHYAYMDNGNSGKCCNLTLQRRIIYSALPKEASTGKMQANAWMHVQKVQL